MPEQFGRELTLELGDIRLDYGRFKGPRIVFQVGRDKSEIPNAAEIAIYNLGKEESARLEQEQELACRLSAGYDGASSQIFYGVVQFARSKFDRSSADYVFRVSAGDGQEEYSGSVINEHFAKGTKIAKVLETLVTKTGLGLGNVTLLKDLALPNGATELEASMTAHGSAVFELQMFADSLGLDWSFQDGAFIGAPAGEPYNASGPLLSSSTGLLDVTLDRRGNVSGEALLLPTLLPGTKFRVEDEKVTGDFVCSASMHSGDTYDEQSWHVGFDGIPLGATSEGLLPEKKDDDAKPTASSIII